MTLKERKSIYKIHILFIALTFLYMLPMFYGLYTWGHDGRFHVSRILGLENVFTSPVNFQNFHAQGTMMSVFYPWLTVYPMYLFYKLTGSIVLAYQLFYSFWTLITFYICYYVGKRIQKDQFAAIIFSIIYTFSGYRTTDIYFRASVGEVLAITFLPIVVLGCYYIFISNYKKWYLLTIGMTLIVYSHVLSVFMTSLVIFFVFISTFLKWDHKKERLISFIYATCLTIGLSLFYFIPFIEQNLYTKIKIPKEPKPLTGMPPHTMLENILDNNLAGFTIGLLVAGLICILIFNRNKLNKVNQFFLYIGLITLGVITSLFPWKIFRHTFMEQIQFEWRFSAFATLFITLAFSGLIKRYKNKKATSFLVKFELLPVK